MPKKWNIIAADFKLQSVLSKKLGVSSLLACLLINRGIKDIEEAEAFINPEMSFLHSPKLLPGIKKAVARIRQAIEKKEKVFIFGDYDVDGVTSSVLLKSALEKAGLIPFCYIPHRIKEGYGINKQAVKLAKDKATDLFISVDCGITNVKEIELLNKYNIDVIIIDHHEPLEILPNALAIVNPKLKDSKYPFRELAGVGVVYKLAQELLGDLLIEDLDLVSLGTIADVVPLMGENRIFVRNGLPRLSVSLKPGIQELIKVAGLEKKQISAHHVGFILGPRINAAGRISSADISFNLLSSVSNSEARGFAETLHLENRRRQYIEGKILNEVLAKVEQEVNFKEHNIIVLNGEGWHQGVLGIIASRITERFYRPTIIISTDNLSGKGSARSIRDFHIIKALAQCSTLLEAYGGHAHAAGITIHKDNIEKFKLMINAIAVKELTIEKLLPVLDIDAQISFKDIDFDIVSSFGNLAPFGRGNSAPVFSTPNLMLCGRPALLGKNTLKFWVSDGKSTYPVIGFGMGGMFELVANAKKLDLAYTPSIDTWQATVNGLSGKDARQIQLELVDLKPSA